MAFLNPSEWNKAVQMSVGSLITISTIIGLYIGVDAWAEDKATAAQLKTLKVVAESQVRNEIDHDKMVQSSRIATSELHIAVTEMKLEELEDEIDERTEEGKEPTARQQRSMERMNKLIEAYETEQADATKKLTGITRTTTTTTEPD